MRISKQLDAEFKYMRGSGTRRHREMCAAKVCETKLAAELRA